MSRHQPQWEKALRELRCEMSAHLDQQECRRSRAQGRSDARWADQVFCGWFIHTNIIPLYNYYVNELFVARTRLRRTGETL